jgi:rhodanese-related sulfurtransferase
MSTLRHHPVTDYAAVVDETTQFIDVRRPDEVAQGTIDGALNLPLEELIDRVSELDPQRRTVLLCRSGNRSTQAGEFLAAAGFVDVVNLDGGMIVYEKAGQP